MPLFKNIHKYNSKICLIDKHGKNYLYRDIIKKSEFLASKISTKKLIFFLASNDVESVSAYLGLYKKGVVQMLIDPNIKKNSLNQLIKNYLPEYLFVPKSYRINSLNYKLLKTFKLNKIYKVIKNKNYNLYKDLGILLPTSGSTGSKKYVRISHSNLEDNTKNITKFLKITNIDRAITTMPFFYTYGLSIINTHLNNGASILVTDQKIVEKKFWENFKKNKITNFGGVPYFYEILQKLKFNTMKLPYLKYFTQAGGHLDVDLVNYFYDYSKKNKIKFIIMYGQTEATSRMAYLPFRYIKKKIGSIGIPIPNGKISIDARNSEIIYKGKNVSLGYAQNYKDLGKGDKNKQILKTGDIGIKDKDGFFYIKGRKSRMVKIYGHRVNLDELEVLLKNLGIKCACISFEKKIIIFYNQRVVAKIIKIISNYTTLNLNYFKMNYIKKFPINENNKISYRNLKYLAC